jgi:hypothetical protein
MTNSKLPLTTEMRIREKSGEEATMENLPVSVMQALYHEITGRTETIDKNLSTILYFATKILYRWSIGLFRPRSNTMSLVPTPNLF